MNSEKIGKFIVKLRLEKNMTQQQLADKISISRQGVSKWENGRTLPDYYALIKLSEIFDVSIDELLAGEKNPKENVSLNLYKDRNNILKKMKLSIAIIFLILFLFGCYYFLNQYNSTRVYTISGGNSIITIENGLFIETKEKIYFNIGTINTKERIEKITLIHKEDGIEKTIYSTDSVNILLKDYDGYEEYFEFGKIKSLINNLYVKLYINNDEYEIKLMFDEDYKNDNIFFFKKTKINDEKQIQVDNLNNSSLINIIKNKFNYENKIYTKTLKNDNYIENYNYYEDINVLIIEILENNSIIEEWIYNMSLNYFTYTNYKEKFSFNYELDNELTECLYGTCNNYSEKYMTLKNKLEKI